MVSSLSELVEQGNSCLNSICGFEFVRHKRTIARCCSSILSDSRYVQTVCVIWIRTKGFGIFCPKLSLHLEKSKYVAKTFKLIKNTHKQVIKVITLGLPICSWGNCCRRRLLTELKRQQILSLVWQRGRRSKIPYCLLVPRFSTLIKSHFQQDHRVLRPDDVPHPTMVFLMWEIRALHPLGWHISSNFRLFTFAGDTGLIFATVYFLTKIQICSFWYFSLERCIQPVSQLDAKPYVFNTPIKRNRCNQDGLNGPLAIPAFLRQSLEVDIWHNQSCGHLLLFTDPSIEHP